MLFSYYLSSCMSKGIICVEVTSLCFPFRALTCLYPSSNLFSIGNRKASPKRILAKQQIHRSGDHSLRSDAVWTPPPSPVPWFSLCLMSSRIQGGNAWYPVKVEFKHAHALRCTISAGTSRDQKRQAQHLFASLTLGFYRLVDKAHPQFPISPCKYFKLPKAKLGYNYNFFFPDVLTKPVCKYPFFKLHIPCS